MGAGRVLSRGMGERWATDFLAGGFGRGAGGLGRAEGVQLVGGGAEGGSGGAGEGGVVETAELVRGTQGAQATKAGSTGDGVPIMEGNSESDNEPGEQPRGVGSFYSLGSSLGRTGGAGDTARAQRGVNPKIGR